MTLPKGTYTFSFYRKVATPVLARRPWWNLMGKDSIEMRHGWERCVLGSLTQQQANLVSGAMTKMAGRSDTEVLISQLIGADAKHAQLEQGKPATPYIQTSGGTA